MAGFEIDSGTVCYASGQLKDGRSGSDSPATMMHRRAFYVAAALSLILTSVAIFALLSMSRLVGPL